MMKYPADFVKKAKAMYPKWKELHCALDKGNEIVGRFIGDANVISMGPADIVEAFAKDREQEVLKEAKAAVERNSLYNEWCILYRLQH